jgi:hypothetical protein
MTYPILISAALLFFYVLVKYLNRTEQAKINGLPEVPGWPLFGSLIELGERHAKVAQEWSKKYGPVFQVRLGNKVRRITLNSCNEMTETTRLESNLITASELSSPTPMLLSESFGLRISLHSSPGRSSTPFILLSQTLQTSL